MIGNLIGGFVSILIGIEFDRKEKLIQTWKDYGYGFKRKFNNYQMNNLIKLAINGELK